MRAAGISSISYYILPAHKRWKDTGKRLYRRVQVQLEEDEGISTEQSWRWVYGPCSTGSDKAWALSRARQNIVNSSEYSHVGRGRPKNTVWKRDLEKMWTAAYKYSWRKMEAAAQRCRWRRVVCDHKFHHERQSLSQVNTNVDIHFEEWYGFFENK